jgi:two-component system response regulator FixJ
MSLPSGPVVHLVDDDIVQRHTAAVVLAHHGFSTRDYPDAEAVLAAFDSLAPGCLVVDLHMPGMSGLELQHALLKRGCTLPLIMITGHAQVAQAVEAMKAGAVDFLEKPFGEAALLGAVHKALSRLAEDSAGESRRGLARARLASLSPRESDVLRGLAAGHANKVIAAELGISPRTVEIHRARLMERLECRSLADVLRVAMEGGVLGG